MDIAEHITTVAREGERLADAARRAGPDAEIGVCPGWTVRDLLRHLAEIHLWAAARVDGRAPGLWPENLDEHTRMWPDLAVFWPPDDELADWYLRTNANLVRCLRAASPDDEMMTFLPAPSPLAMWARRQAHETAMHRLDAEIAAGEPTGFDPAFAADGIDEIIVAFAPRMPPPETDRPRSLTVHATDTGDRWTLTLASDGTTSSRLESTADAPDTEATVRGTAADLYRVLWNRADDDVLTVDGDAEVLQLWHRSILVRWSA